jgi:hypothetical protein
MWSESKMFLVADIGIKLLIVFMPKKVNAVVEGSIFGAHFERIIENFYGFCVGEVSRIHCSLTRILMGAMHEEHKILFKNELINTLK